MLTASAAPVAAHVGVICSCVPLNAPALWGKVALDTGTASEGTCGSLCVSAGLCCARAAGRAGVRAACAGSPGVPVAVSSSW